MRFTVQTKNETLQQDGTSIFSVSLTLKQGATENAASFAPTPGPAPTPYGVGGSISLNGLNAAAATNYTVGHDVIIGVTTA